MSGVCRTRPIGDRAVTRQRVGTRLEHAAGLVRAIPSGTRRSPRLVLWFSPPSTVDCRRGHLLQIGCYLGFSCQLTPHQIGGEAEPNLQPPPMECELSVGCPQAWPVTEPKSVAERVTALTVAFSGTDRCAEAPALDRLRM